ncbi:MAG: sugar ABC transporter permease [Acholeplasmataceae bacterium]
MKKILQFISKILKKVGHFLTHNWFIEISNKEIIWFHKFHQTITNRFRESIQGYAFISIWIFGFLTLTLYPLVTSIFYSINKVTITGGQGIQFEMVGFDNYVQIFTTDLDFMQYLQSFIGDIILQVPIILIISMLIAILLNQKIKLRGFFRSIYFLPVIIVSGPVINELLQQDAGSIPLIQELAVIETIEAALPAFLAEPITNLFSEIIIILWFSGVQIVLFLAGLQKIDGEIYEAAQIDGASPWESFWKITLPSLRPIILVSAVYTIVMLATFSTNSIIKHIQTLMFDTSRGYGYSAALSWVYFIVVAMILGIAVLLIAYQKKPKTKKVRG